MLPSVARSDFAEGAFVQRDFGAGDDIEVTYIDEIQITDEGKLNERPKNFFDSWVRKLEDIN